MRKNSDVSLPVEGERRSSEFAKSARFGTFVPDNSEEDTQSGAQENPIASGRRDVFDDGDGGNDAASKSTKGNDGSASTLLGNNNHNAPPTLPANPAPNQLSSPVSQKSPRLPLGGSLENLQERLNYNSRPARKKKRNALLNYIAGPARTKKKPQKPTAPQVHIEEPTPEAAPETEDYRAFIEELASHFPTFQNVATVEARHDWSSRIVFYDCPRDLEGSIRKHEPWPLEDDGEIPSFAEFKGILTGIPDECTQRLILIEDLTPALIDLLGATFQIPPHVFEEHLELVVLLDPLPVVTVEAEELVSAKKRRQRVIPTMANLWYRQQEQAARARNAKRVRNESQRRKHVHDWIAETGSQHHPPEYDQNQEPSTGPDPGSSERQRAQTTGVDQNEASSDFTPGPLRQEVEIGKEKKVDLVMLDTHQDFVVYEPIKARASSTDTGSAYQIETYIESIRNPRSTLDEFEHFLMSSKGKNRTFDPLQALFQTIHDDTSILVDIIRTSMQRIREGTLDEEFMQKRVKFWRSLLHRLGFHLGVLQQGLREFEQFVFEQSIFEPESHVPQIDILSQTLSQDTQRMLSGCMELIDRSSHSLLAEMQIADSRRGIAEAESVSKLTELAFVFIPLSFVASLFSMQIHELDGGVPVYQFALVAIAIVIAAYAVRLSIRSERLLEYRDNFMRQVHEDSGLRPDEKLPTHKFVAWAGANIGSTMLKNSKNTAAVLAPIVVAMTVIAAVLSPIVLLWQRNIDAGFSVAITVLIILLDGVLVVPVAVNMSNAGLINFDPRDRIRRIQAAHERNRKRRQKERRRRRREAGLDPEAPYEESSLSSDIHPKRRTGSLYSSMTSVS
ncbi:hypothetical protein E8E11_006437 [Didymella keratinophila]|nr:hypothetical protein E8E11_006437 [Didymella keratinophila]